MKPDPEMVQLLIAGLLAQDWRETANAGSWRRFAKWGRGAMYVYPDGSLWFSEIRFTEPDAEVKGPILEQIFAAGCAAQSLLKPPKARIDADTALDELMGRSR